MNAIELDYLGISAKDLSFYEEIGLIAPTINPDYSKNYSQEDESYIKQLLILTKLAVPMHDALQAIRHELPLDEILQTTLDQQKKDNNAPEGPIRFLRELLNAHVTIDTLDVDRYWEDITRAEANGISFHMTSAEAENLSRIEASAFHDVLLFFVIVAILSCVIISVFLHTAC